MITLNGDVNITHEAGSAYHDANATWTDAVDGSGSYVQALFCDAAGNAAQAVTRTVIVEDTTSIVPGTYFIVFNLTGSTSIPGTYFIVFNLTDSSGNVSYTRSEGI